MTTVSVPVPVVQLVNAVNSRDRAAFLAAFRDDGVVDDCGRRFEGLRAIEGWSDVELIGDNCHLTLREVRRDSEADTVVVLVDVVSMGFNGATTFTFTLAGDRVQEMRLTD